MTQSRLPLIASVLVVLLSAFLLASPALAQDPPEQKLSDDDGTADSHMGTAIAIDGDTMMAGAPRNDSNRGVVVVYVRVSDTWREQQRLTLSSARDFDQFGASIVLDGDTALIGAPTLTPDPGRVHLFARRNGVWTQGGELKASDETNANRFGKSMQRDGDSLIIGAEGVGAAYVFTRTNGVWTEEDKLVASDAGAAELIAKKVALSGDTAVVSAEGEDSEDTNAGAAYVFTRLNRVWTEQQKLTASDAAASQFFGVAVAVFRDTVMVTSIHRDNFKGGVYVFTRDNGRWTEDDILTGFERAGAQDFGSSIQLDADRAYIGARSDHGAAQSAGAAYVYHLDTGTWTGKTKLLASDAADFDSFGSSIAFADGTLVVGAILTQDNGNNTGAAYVYDLAPLGVATGTLADTTETATTTGQLDASGGTPPFVWTILNGASPFNQGVLPTSGSLDGQVSTAGPYAFTAQVEDAAGRIAAKPFQLTVNAAPALQATRTTTVFVPGRVYVFRIVASGGTTPLTFSAPGGFPVPGLALDGATGEIRGTVPVGAVPTGTTAEVIVTDAAGVTAMRTFDLLPGPLVAFPSKKTKSKFVDLELLPRTDSAERHGLMALELVGGTLLSVQIKMPRDSASVDVLEITDAAGDTLTIDGLVKVTRSGVKLKKLLIPMTGRYFVRVRGLDGFQGPVRVKFLVSPPKKQGGEVLIPLKGISEDVPITALPNSKLTVFVKTAKGSNFAPTILSIRDAEGNDLLVPDSVKHKGRKAKAVVQTGAGTEFTVRFGLPSGNSETVTWGAKIKSPKGYEFVLPDATPEN